MTHFLEAGSIDISIHAPPRRSATPFGTFDFHSLEISIHAPPRRSATEVTGRF